MKTSRPVQQKKQVAARQVPRKAKSQGFVMNKNMEILLLSLILLITVIIYFPALQNKFTNWDDGGYVTDNTYIKSLSGENVGYMFTKPIASNFHPLTILSLALNYQVSGMKPFSYFLVNIIFHLFNIVLTYYFALLILGRNKLLALFVAAIFAVHPMHVESVAWISERKDVLYTFFFLSSMIAWVMFISKKQWMWYLFSLALFFLAGLSKPSAVVLPLILLLLDFLYKRKFNLQQVAEKIPFFAISIWIGLATIHAQSDLAAYAIKNYNFAQQFLFAAFGFLIYIVRLFVPVGLSAMHPVPVFNTSLDLPPFYFAAPVLVLVLAGFVLYSLKHTRLLLFGLMFYLLNIVLTLQFMQVGSAVYSERYTYVSYIGLLIGVAWLLDQAAAKYKMPRTALYTIMILFFGINVVLAAQRVPVWHDSETLWTDVIAKYPENDGAYNSRGWYYITEKQYDKALPDLNRAVELHPKYLFAHYNRGTVHRKQDRPRMAVSDYNVVLSIDSTFILAHSDRGNAYFTLGIIDSALLDFNWVLQKEPANAVALGNRGSVFFRMGRFEKAIDDFTQAISADHRDSVSYLNRGVAYSSLGKWDEAIADYTFVIKAATDNPKVYEWRGIAYRSKGELQKAIDDFSMGIRLNPNIASIYMNRAMAYQKAGLGEKAAGDLSKVRQLSPNGN